MTRYPEEGTIIHTEYGNRNSPDGKDRQIQSAGGRKRKEIIRWKTALPSASAADKAKELAAIANLKSQISTCEEVMKKNYLEIGKIYFEQYSDMPEPPFEKQCETIKNSQRAIADLQEKIEQLKTK